MGKKTRSSSKKKETDTRGYSGYSPSRIGSAQRGDPMPTPARSTAEEAPNPAPPTSGISTPGQSPGPVQQPDPPLSTTAPGIPRSQWESYAADVEYQPVPERLPSRRARITTVQEDNDDEENGIAKKKQ